MWRVCWRDAVRSIGRAPGPAALCAVAVAAALVLPSLLALVWTNWERIREAAIGDARVVAFARADASRADVDALAHALAGRPGVAGARVLAPAEVAAWLAAQYPDLAGVSNAEAAELFPYVVEAAVAAGTAPETRDGLAAHLRASSAIEEVDAGTWTLQRLEAIAHTARRAGLGAGLLLGLVAVLGIGAAVRLSLHARRDEIEILRLVGATPAYVRAPFLIEGLLLGAAGAVLALGATAVVFALGLREGAPWSLPFGGLHVAFLPPLAVTALAGAGAALGLGGSALGLARHLRGA